MRILYNNNEDIVTEMIQFFWNEKQGMFRADMCRGAALYETGGLYFDVDLAVRMSAWTVVKPTTEFVTVHAAFGGFFQAFIGVTPSHPVIARYKTLFYQYYKGTMPQRSDVKNGLRGVFLFKRAFDEIQSEQQQGLCWKENATNQILGTENEKSDQLTNEMQAGLGTRQVQSAVVDAGTTSSCSSPITETQLYNTSQLWFEMAYDERYKIPYPTWGGTSWNCKVIVATSKMESESSSQQQSKNSFSFSLRAKDLIVDEIPAVPFYSRISYSRICLQQ
jgi:Glycosyltransferase sugar-binding region containing DXD motif